MLVLTLEVFNPIMMIFLKKKKKKKKILKISQPHVQKGA